MRLSKQQIREIIVAHAGGTTKAQIAERLHVDRSTVYYHVEKFESQGENVYSLLQSTKPHECCHPSTKCFVCGKLMDNLKREERIIIGDIRSKLALANHRLRTAGLPVVE